MAKNNTLNIALALGVGAVVFFVLSKDKKAEAGSLAGGLSEECYQRVGTAFAKMWQKPGTDFSVMASILDGQGFNEAADCMRKKIAAPQTDCTELLKVAVLEDMKQKKDPEDLRGYANTLRANGFEFEGDCLDTMATDLEGARTL